jgi:hypothetical protein
MKVKVYTPQVYFVAFLMTRGHSIVEDKEEVLHYFGNSLKELNSLVNQDRPDLVIINSKSFKMPKHAEDLKFNFVYDPIACETDIYKQGKIITNCLNLCQLYYSKLGLIKEIDVLFEKHEMPSSPFKNKILEKIFKIMYWN